MKTNLLKNSSFLNFDISMITFLRFTALVSMLPFLAGCAGMMADSMGHSLATGDTYGEIRSSFSPVTDGKGRLYIYRTSASTKKTLKANYGIAKNVALCTVDDTVYDLIWESFRYFDLSAGNHEVSCGNDLVKKQSLISAQRNEYQKGSNIIALTIADGSDVFVRVDAIEKEPLLKPTLVNAEQGRKEIFNLPFQETGYSIGFRSNKDPKIFGSDDKSDN